MSRKLSEVEKIKRAADRYEERRLRREAAEAAIYTWKEAKGIADEPYIRPTKDVLLRAMNPPVTRR